MARVRYIKPGFFTNDKLSECDPLGRLLFAGLWCIADREGRLRDRPKKIKAELLPYDNCDIDNLLVQLHENNFITRYSIDRINYIQIENFNVHQNPHIKEIVSKIPPYLGHIDNGTIPYYVPPLLREEIFKNDEYKCVECGSTDNLSIDHIIPRSKGGTNKKENLRTLCIKCNSKKRDKIIPSMGKSETSTGKSETSNKKYYSDHAVPVPVPDTGTEKKPERDSAPLNCPHESIKELFRDILPELPQITTYTKSREDTVRARWKENPTLDYFEKYFKQVKESDFLMGNNDKSWKAYFDWLMKPSNMSKVIEGNYINHKNKKPGWTTQGVNNE